MLHWKHIDFHSLSFRLGLWSTTTHGHTDGISRAISIRPESSRFENTDADSPQGQGKASRGKQHPPDQIKLAALSVQEDEEGRKHDEWSVDLVEHKESKWTLY